MARPAASALVHPSGLRPLPSSRKTAPESAFQRETPCPSGCVELEEDPPVPVHEQHVAVAGGPAARLAALDPLRLGPRAGRDRVARGAPGRADVALVRVAIAEVDDLERLGPGHHGVDHSVGAVGRPVVAAEVGMERRRAADEADEARAARIERRRGDVGVPPVVGREERQGGRERGGRLRRLRRGRKAEEARQREGEPQGPSGLAGAHDLASEVRRLAPWRPGAA